MDRRRFLTAVGTVTALGTAGCIAIPEDEETPGDGVEPTATNETETTPANETTTPGNETTTTTAGGGQGATNTIEMVTDGSEYFFDPIGLYVEPGETITWRIESGAHSSTAYAESLDAANVTRIPPDAEAWDSGILSEMGAEFTHTFEVEGTYDYFCIPHKTLGMVARLVVGEPGDVEGDPPDGNVPAEQRIVEERVVSYDEFTG